MTATPCRLLLFVLLAFATPDTHAQPAPPTDIPSRAQALLQQLATDGDTDAARDAANRLLIEAALYADSKNIAAFAEAAYAHGLTQALHQTPQKNRAKLTQRLLARPKTAHEIASLLIVPSRDNFPEVFALFLKLDDAFGEKLETFPGLAAALCVVHDRKIQRHVNENKVYGTDPVALFRFYTANEKQMLFGMRDVPGSLLVWVVDSTSSIEEMTWALNEYHGDRAIGRRFFDIKYDYNHLRKGSPKKVTQAGFSLPNIRKHGGICADQAYFAVAVGKAIGVPATYTYGQGGDVAHAWVGYFEQRGRKGGWNFNEGRYKVYQGVRGVVEHPQYGVVVDDSFVSVLAEAITLPPTKRYAAAGMVKAAHLLSAVADEHFKPEAFAPPTPQGAVAPVPRRTVSTTDHLALIQDGLSLDPGFAWGWMSVADMAKRGQLTAAQKQQWAKSVTRLCGDRYPDFAVMVLRPIIASIEKPAQQSDLWEAAYKRFRARKDLAAEIRMAQGALWEEQGDLARAAGFYEDVLRKFANDGPFVVTALERFEALLIEAGRPERVLVLYREAFKAIDKPDRMSSQFANQSNYYKVGSRLVQMLRDAGDTRTAKQVDKEVVAATGLHAGE